MTAPPPSHHRAANAFSAAAFGFLLLACSDGAETRASPVGGAQDSGTPEAGTPRTLSGNVLEFSPGAADPASRALLAGVSVCVYQHPEIPCVTTDDGGRSEISGAKTQEPVALTFEKEGYVGCIYPRAGSDALPLESALPSTGVAAAFSQLVGGTYPFGDTGVILGEPSMTGEGDASSALVPLPGVSLTMTPKSGKGPFYATDEGVPDPTLSATTRGSWGGGFTNVDPGTITLAFSHPSRDCSEIGFGWPSESPHSLRAPVAAGFVTIVGMTCR